MEIRSYSVAVVTAASLAVVVVSTAFSAIFAVALTLDKVSIHGLAIVAAVSNALAFVFLCTLSLQFWIWSSRTTRISWPQVAVIGADILTGLLATSLTATVLVLMVGDATNRSHKALGPQGEDLVIVAFVFWGLSIFAHAAVYCVYGFAKRPYASHRRMSSQRMEEPARPGPEPVGLRLETTDVPQPEDKTSMREAPAPLVLRILTSSYASDDAMVSPPPSAKSSDSKSRFRASLHQAVHPVSSRSRLLSRQPFQRDSRSSHSDQRSIAGSSHSDGFDAWDTSEVDSHARETVMQSAPTQRTALEPIPGSRPASPAKALDGPFPAQDSEIDLTAPVSSPKPIQTESCPASPRMDESHIHPLFRTDSPTPPPSATPGTIVTASPFGGQVLPSSAMPFTRARSNSRPKSPSPLKNSRSFESNPVRHPPLPRRKTNPPIPDFVLSAGSEASWTAYGKRKDSASLELPR